MAALGVNLTEEKRSATKASSVNILWPINGNIDENVCSIRVYHVPTMSFVGFLKYETSVDEIFDLHIIKGYTSPNILNTINDLHKKEFL